MVLKHQQLLKTPLFGLEEDEITWFSNSKRFSECCTVGLADVKLHGAQTGFLRCADEFPAWTGELHGTQTHRNIQETTNLVWKKVKLHGTQTINLSRRENLERCEITWFSNACYTFQPEHIGSGRNCRALKPTM